MSDNSIMKHVARQRWSRFVSAGFRLQTERTWFPRRCPCCRSWRRTVTVRRLNTTYVDDDRNFLRSCDDCYEMSVEHYDDLWSDYYRDCL